MASVPTAACTLEDVCNFLGKGKRKASFGKDSGDFIFVPSAAITKYCDTADHQEPSIVLGDGGVANVHFIDSPFSASDHTYILRAKDASNTNLKYVYYNLLANIDYIQQGFGGAAIKNVSKAYLKSIPLYLPCISEQQRIVDKLDALFSNINVAKQIVEKNIYNIKQLFESFSDMLFETPNEHWVHTTLGSISKQKQHKSEITLQDSDFVTFAPMECLGIKKKYLHSDLVRKLKEVRSGYTYFAENDLLMAKITPCFENGKIGIAQNLKNGIGFGSSEYIVFRTSDAINREFLYYFLNRQSFRAKGAKRMLGASGHKRVAKDFIDTYPFQYPSNVDAQTAIIKQLDELHKQTQQLEQIYTQQIADLDELKQSILKKAFNGEL